MANRKSSPSGRKNNNERIRELVALMAALSRTGDSITIEAISTRLGVSQDEARSLMDIVCMASGEDIGGLLLSSNEDESEYTLQYPTVHGVPIRLTTAETIALMHAMDVAGIAEDDPLRQRLQAAFTSPDVLVDEVRKTLGGFSGEQHSLMVCAQAQAENRVLEFWYKGMKDDEPRPRRVSVTRLTNDGSAWYVRALDLDLDEERTFRGDRMSHVELGDPLPSAPIEKPAEQAELVRITFLDKSYYTVFDWPGIKVVTEYSDRLVCDIPYYGERSTWLLRRICAGGGSIIAEDERIMQRVREYAEGLL